MTEHVRKVLEAARKLTEDEQLLLAEEILSGLPDENLPDNGSRRAYGDAEAAEEAERRLDEFLARGEPGIPAEVVFSKYAKRP